MTKRLLSRRGFGALAIGTGAVALVGPVTAQDRLQIASVNYPLAYFAERVAGDLADVLFLIPEGTDPSFWRPGIADISAFQGADLILLNGAAFADWTAQTTLPRSRVVNTSAGFEDAFIATETVTHSHGEGGAHSHTGTASYVWLDFLQAIQQAEAIASALIRRAPEAESTVSDNLAALVDDLTTLHAEALSIGPRIDDLHAITSHPRYQYFGRAYGLSLTALDWDANEIPSEEQWRALEALIEETEAGVFIWEATPGQDALDRVADLGLNSVVFPPLANRPADGDFLTAMRTGLAQMQDAVLGATDG